MTKHVFAISALTLFTAAAGLMATNAAPAAPAALAADGAFKVDPVHSSVVFRIRHNTSFFYGRFNQVSGSFDLNADASKSALDITVKTDSIDSNNAKRDQHLKSQDFFSATEFPSITFKGKDFKKSADNKWEVKGDLTLHGVTKPVTVAVEDTAAGAGGGLEAKFTIKRSDYGMGFMSDKGLGDEVTIMVGLEGKK